MRNSASAPLSPQSPLSQHGADRASPADDQQCRRLFTSGLQPGAEGLRREVHAADLDLQRSDPMPLDHSPQMLEVQRGDVAHGEGGQERSFDEVGRGQVVDPLGNAMEPMRPDESIEQPGADERRIGVVDPG